MTLELSYLLGNIRQVISLPKVSDSPLSKGAEQVSDTVEELQSTPSTTEKIK